MKPLSERITEAVNAISEATAAGKQASLQALQTYFGTLLAEVQALEAKNTAE